MDAYCSKSIENAFSRWAADDGTINMSEIGDLLEEMPSNKRIQSWLPNASEIEQAMYQQGKNKKSTISFTEIKTFLDKCFKEKGKTTKSIEPTVNSKKSFDQVEDAMALVQTELESIAPELLQKRDDATTSTRLKSNAYHDDADESKDDSDMDELMQSIENSVRESTPKTSPRTPDLASRQHLTPPPSRKSHMTNPVKHESCNISTVEIMKFHDDTDEESMDLIDHQKQQALHSQVLKLDDGTDEDSMDLQSTGKSSLNISQVMKFHDETDEESIDFRKETAKLSQIMRFHDDTDEDSMDFQSTGKSSLNISQVMKFHDDTDEESMDFQSTGKESLNVSQVMKFHDDDTDEDSMDFRSTDKNKASSKISQVIKFHDDTDEDSMDFRKTDKKEPSKLSQVMRFHDDTDEDSMDFRNTDTSSRAQVMKFHDETDESTDFDSTFGTEKPLVEMVKFDDDSEESGDFSSKPVQGTTKPVQVMKLIDENEESTDFESSVTESNKPLTQAVKFDAYSDVDEDTLEESSFEVLQDHKTGSDILREKNAAVLMKLADDFETEESSLEEAPRSPVVVGRLSNVSSRRPTPAVVKPKYERPTVEDKPRIEANLLKQGIENTRLKPTSNIHKPTEEVKTVQRDEKPIVESAPPMMHDPKVNQGDANRISKSSKVTKKVLDVPRSLKVLQGQNEDLAYALAVTRLDLAKALEELEYYKLRSNALEWELRQRM